MRVPPASVLPSGDKASEQIPLGTSLSACDRLPSATCQRMISSCPGSAKMVPSGDSAMQLLEKSLLNLRDSRGRLPKLRTTCPVEASRSASPPVVPSQISPLLSGVNSTVSPEPTGSFTSSFPSTTFHTRISPETPADASSFPSGEYTIDMISSPWRNWGVPRRSIATLGSSCAPASASEYAVKESNTNQSDFVGDMTTHLEITI